MALALYSGCTPQLLFQHKDYPSALDLSVPEPVYEHVLEPDDKIIISVWGHEELGVGSAFGVYSSNEAFGKYISINQQGEITLPLLGDVRLAGLTVREANLYLRQLYAKYISHPIVYLRVLNHSVTLLGEVRTPGNYEIDREQKSVVEVIGQAGGFTDYADASAVKLLRKNQKGEVEEYVIDLTDIESLYLSNLHVQNRDILYVPERRNKQFEKVVSGLLVPIVGVLGTASLIFSVIKK
ncbi:MAG: polysaccharide export protein [Bacteroidetes bacterium]|nr:MAG: polysaccharide export protein [Bacteroidota bacterium]